MTRIAFLFSLCVTAFAAEGYRGGVARVDITPDVPIWLSGYASRTKPSEGVLHRLWAKALVLESRRNDRVVIVTTDLIGLPRAITDLVGARVEKEFRIPRARVLMNSSHTHTGPVVRPNLKSMYDLAPEQERIVSEYAVRLTGALVSVIGAAIKDLEPVSVSYGTGRATFAANRREHTPKGVRIGVNPNGPVDHDLPVLRVSDSKGQLRAVLFGYACHNTTLTGEHYGISGDYAGAAQLAIEQGAPGATALFVELCAGDQNPNPRSDVKHVEQHGSALASEVRRVLDGKLSPVRGGIRAAMQWVDLPLSPHTRADFEKMLGDESVYQVRLAKEMLKAYDERHPVRVVPYPVQAFRLGDDLAIIALGGETVVEYGLKTKAAYPRMKMIVAGYSNDVACYIPTKKMLEEGGYEPVTSMVYYGMPAPFAPEVEERVHSAIRAVLSRVGVK